MICRSYLYKLAVLRITERKYHDFILVLHLKPCFQGLRVSENLPNPRSSHSDIVGPMALKLHITSESVDIGLSISLSFYDFSQLLYTVY